MLRTFGSKLLVLSHLTHHGRELSATVNQSCLHQYQHVSLNLALQFFHFSLLQFREFDQYALPRFQALLYCLDQRLKTSIDPCQVHLCADDYHGLVPQVLCFPYDIFMCHCFPPYPLSNMVGYTRVSAILYTQVNRCRTLERPLISNFRITCLT